MVGKDILTAETVQKVIGFMYPFNVTGEEASEKNVLKQLSLFDYRTLDALVETGSTDDLHQLIQETANVILRHYDALGEKEKHKIHWGEEKNKMIQELEPMFTDWFKKAQHQVNLLDRIHCYEDNIKRESGRVKKMISALISTEEEALEMKNQISVRYQEIEKNIFNEDILPLPKKEELKEKISQAMQESFNFVDVKLQEEPIHLLYYRTGSRVSVKVNLQRSGYRYTQGRGKEIRYNKGADREQFPLIVSASYIEDFLYTNGVRDEDLLVDPDSVDQFYGFDGHVSVNLTPGFISEWYNYDCPTLYRYSPNKERHTNMLGMPICHFSNNLVESTWTTVYIDESITEKEAEALMKDYGHTRISSEIRNVLKAKKVKESGQLEAVERYVNQFDQQIQQVINHHHVQIMNELATRLGVRAKTGTDGAIMIDNNFGLDCGFLNIYTTHPEYKEKRSILRNAKSSVSPWMNLSLPYSTQSTTVQRMQFDIIKGIVKKELGIDLYAETLLD